MLFAQGVLGRGVLPWVLCCLPTLGMSDALSDSLIACTQLTSDTARLACFDHGMEEMRKGTSNAPSMIAPTPTAVHAHVVSVSRYMNERQVFVLDNVQSWQQIELDPDFTARNGQEVTISSGALGSFWLSTDSRHRTRVKRIR
jgi:hypothetical protein